MASIKINSLSNLIRFITNVAIGLLLTPFILDSLGKSGYGIWTLIGSFVGYYGLLNIGLDAAIRRYISVYTAQGKSNDLNKVASTAMIIFSLTGLIVIIISVVFSNVIADFFKVSSEHHLDFTRLVSIMGLTTGLAFPAGVFSAIITAREHYVLINAISFLNQVIRSILTVIFLTYGGGLTGLGLATLIATVFLIAGNYFLFKRYANDISIDISHFSSRSLRMMMIFAIPAFIISIGDLLRIQFDIAIIGRYLNIDMVGVYGIATLLIRFLVSGVGSIIHPVEPRFAHLHGKNDQKGLQLLFLKSLSISATISCLFTILFLFCGSSFIKLWVGGSFDEATPVLWILALSYLFDLMQKPSILILLAIKKHHNYAWLIVGEGIVNIVCSIALVSEYGIIGVALGTAISTVLVRVIIQPVLISRIMNISLVKYLSALTPSLFIFSILLAALIYFNQAINELLYSYSSLIIACFILSLIYVGNIMIISKQLRGMVISVFSKAK